MISQRKIRIATIQSLAELIFSNLPLQDALKRQVNARLFDDYGDEMGSDEEVGVMHAQADLLARAMMRRLPACHRVELQTKPSRRFR